MIDEVDEGASVRRDEMVGHALLSFATG